jgi:hypothetical protein
LLQGKADAAKGSAPIGPLKATLVTAGGSISHERLEDHFRCDPGEKGHRKSCSAACVCRS